jgi:hypothetical protein
MFLSRRKPFGARQNSDASALARRGIVAVVRTVQSLFPPRDFLRFESYLRYGKNVNAHFGWLPPPSRKSTEYRFLPQVAGRKYMPSTALVRGTLCRCARGGNVSLTTVQGDPRSFQRNFSRINKEHTAALIARALADGPTITMILRARALGDNELLSTTCQCCRKRRPPSFQPTIKMRAKLHLYAIIKRCASAG